MAVSSADRPIILPFEIFVRTHVDHRLYSKNMARLHESNSFVLPVMRHLRILVEMGTDAMTDVSSHDRKTEGLYMIRNDISQISVHSTWLARFDCLHQCIVRTLNKKSRGFSNLTN